MNFTEIVKYLHQNEFTKNPPDFNVKLNTIERLDSLIGFENFLKEDKSNKSLVLTYIIVGFNWVMKDIIEGQPDLYNLTNLQFKVALLRNQFDDDMSNYYVEMLHAFLSSVALYYCDKSNEALSEFNITMGNILSTAAKFWTHDFKEEYMSSKAPEKFITKSTESCSSCGPDCNCK